jgi:two-component system nitrogen regulation response regulator GlnG
VRIIAATHQDLEARVRDGSFREDLYHRLNVIRVHVPALRDRREDILALLRHFLFAAAEELGAATKTLGPDVERYLATMSWPGNVRQLENLCRWLTVMASGNQIQLSDLPPELRESPQTAPSGDDWQAQLRRWAERHLAAGENALLDAAVPRFEQVMIETALSASGGRRQDAARLLGWGRNTLTRKIKEHGLQFDD